jgi:hypothetical protein
MDITDYIKTIKNSITEIDNLKVTSKDSNEFNRWQAVILNLFEQFPLIYKNLRMTLKIFHIVL